MPSKYATLPEWVIPILHFAGTALGYVLLGVVGVLAVRHWRPGAWAIAVILVVTGPFVVESLSNVTPPLWHLLPASWEGAVRAVRTGYEVVGVILAVWLGTIWYRNNLGNEF
jgi:hypothetical protein